MSRTPADPPSGARVWPLDGPRATMMDSLVSALVVVRSAIPRAMALPADIDIVAAEGPVGESVIAATSRAGCASRNGASPTARP